MSPLAGATFGLVGALEAFPRRLAAREVERQGGVLRRTTGRGVTDVVFGRTLLARLDAEAIARRAADEAGARRRLVSETGFLRRLGLRPAPAPGALGRAALVEQSGLAERDLDLLTLFDAFGTDAEPFGFRDLILARSYAGLIAGDATWRTIAQAVRRADPAAPLSALRLTLGPDGAVIVDGPAAAEIDGQLRLDLDAPDDEVDGIFARAEAAEAEGRHDEAAGLYLRCLALDPRDPVAAFNRGNCLRAAGRPVEAAQDYIRVLKRDPGFVEAWFNLAGLMRARGHPASARRHLLQAIARDPDYADAIYNLAGLEYETGDLAAAGRLWRRYLELDDSSDWARTAARGVRYAESQGAG